jgi:hypothetical protein
MTGDESRFHCVYDSSRTFAQERAAVAQRLEQAIDSTNGMVTISEAGIFQACTVATGREM